MPIVTKQIDEKTFVQATLSTIGNRLTEVVLPIPKNEYMRKEIAIKMEESIKSRADSKSKINNLFNDSRLINIPNDNAIEQMPFDEIGLPNT
jgi:type I restriction enzyme M protein